MRPKQYILIYLLTVLTACKTTNVLQLKHKKYYSDRSILTSDTIRTLFQVVSYDQPNVIDEEFSYQMSFQFTDTASAKLKRFLNLVTDTAIVKTNYRIASIWNWEKDTYVLSGNIEILKWTTDSIILRQNVVVDDKRRKEVLKFIGKRTFTKHKNW